MPFEIERIVTPSRELLVDLSKLLPQLSKKRKPPTYAALTETLSHPGFFLIVARDLTSHRVIGMGSITVAPLITGTKAYLDDLVIDQDHRNGGIAEAITEAVLNQARVAGARSVSFTSSPSRVAANKFYARFGFQQRDTNVYHLDL